MLRGRPAPPGGAIHTMHTLTGNGSCANFVIGVTQGEGLRVYLLRAKPARPYIWRLIILILLTLPSMAAEL